MLETVNDIIAHLGESPVWNEEDGCLYYADIYGGVIYRHTPDVSTDEYYRGELMPGGICFDRSGVMLIFSQRGVFSYDGRRTEKLFELDFGEHENFNDVIADPCGRVYAGTVDRSPGALGRLWCFENGHMPRVMLEGIGCTNGMGFSSDNKTFYHTDSRSGCIMAYDYDAADGNINRRATVWQSAPGDGVPDGMTTDADDYIWSAFWGGGCVRRISPAGDCVATIPTPARQPSSVAFGGARLDTLYITSACEGGDDLTRGYRGDVFLGGVLYRCVPGTRGKCEYRARLI